VFAWGYLREIFAGLFALLFGYGESPRLDNRVFFLGVFCFTVESGHEMEHYHAAKDVQFGISSGRREAFILKITPRTFLAFVERGVVSIQGTLLPLTLLNCVCFLVTVVIFSITKTL
jgi:hypothetical protein